MATNFYLKKESAAEIDIETNFDIKVTSVRGLNPPQPKKIFTRDWATEDGVDYYVGTARNIKSSEVTIVIYAESDATKTAIEKYRELHDYIISEIVPIRYRDTLQYQQVNLIYNANKPAWYQLYGDNQKLQAEITFFNPTGLVTDVRP